MSLHTEHEQATITLVSLFFHVLSLCKDDLKQVYCLSTLPEMALAFAFPSSTEQSLIQKQEMKKHRLRGDKKMCILVNTLRL